MAKKLKTYEVLVKALDNFSLVSLDINVLNKKGENVFKKIKESAAEGWPVPYLSFIEENGEPFTLKVMGESKGWNGTMYYSTDGMTWNTWSGSNISSSNDGKLFVRGKSNTRVSYKSDYKPWVLTSNKRIKCQGNIENLLDYEVVGQGKHPKIADYCYSKMFSGCTSLTQAPELPATTLAYSCYYTMFQDCTNLTKAPELPATTLAYNCYYNMFRNCTSLTQAPALPATKLTESCYSFMFSGCTNLIKAPDLPATTLASECYSYMFQNCTNLTQVPELPATTLADQCYSFMFSGCTNLTQVPELPATTLAYDCYYNMFQGCTSLTGTIHCPASTASDLQRFDTEANIPANTATVVYDL